jgi:glycosyltransferase-like protein LARGE
MPMMTREKASLSHKKASLSHKTVTILLSMLALTILASNNTHYIHRSLQQQQQQHVQAQAENSYPQEQQERHSQSPQKPSMLTDLLHLFETLPNTTREMFGFETLFNDTNSSTLTRTKLSHPPFREVSHAFSRQRASPLHHVTLATQMSVSKFPRLLQLLERWNGPISCAVHLPDPNAIRTLVDLVTSQDQTFHDLVTIHVMLERPNQHFDYPINRLRNVALFNVDTNYFFNVDVDFMPRKNAHDHLVKFLSHQKSSDNTFKTLYVMPAFELFGEEGTKNNSTVTRLDRVPKIKKQVLALLSRKKLEPFHIDYYPEGHAATNYNKWLKCPKEDSYPITYTFRFEPYVVGTRHGIHAFNERLRGFGLNKASWIAEAHFLGYKFQVLCNQFVVHMNHGGRKGRRAGSNMDAVQWFQKTYLPARYNLQTSDFMRGGSSTRRRRRLRRKTRQKKSK